MMEKRRSGSVKMLLCVAAGVMGLLSGLQAVNTMAAQKPQHMAPVAYTRSYEDTSVVYTADIDEL